MARPEIVKRLRGAAEFAREFGSPQGADIYEVAADEIEQSVRVSEVLDLIAWLQRLPWGDRDGALSPFIDSLRSGINQLAGKAETRALIDNRTPAETAEAKAWSDDAHARIQAGEVSGSHDLMRAKVGEYRANTREAE